MRLENAKAISRLGIPSNLTGSCNCRRPVSHYYSQMLVVSDLTWLPVLYSYLTCTSITIEPISLYHTYLVVLLSPTTWLQFRGFFFVFPAKSQLPRMAGWVCGCLWNSVFSITLPCSSPKSSHIILEEATTSLHDQTLLAIADWPKMGIWSKLHRCISPKLLE